MRDVLVSILVVCAVFVGVPVMAYLIAKFAAAGYFRAKSLLQNRPPSPPGSEVKGAKNETENER